MPISYFVWFNFLFCDAAKINKHVNNPDVAYTNNLPLKKHGG